MDDGRSARQVIDVLDEATAAGDVGDLAAEADGNDRQAELIGAAKGLEFEVVATRIEHFGARVPRLAVVARVEIGSAGEKQRVAAGQ